MIHREIEFYKTDSGRSDVEVFIESSVRLRQVRANVMLTLEALEIMERPPVSLFKKLKGYGDLWEVRVEGLRLLGFHSKNQFVLVHGFLKKSQKTPLPEIEVAVRRRAMYLQRTG